MNIAKAATKSISKTDLIRIETSLKKLLKATKGQQIDQDYLTLLQQLSANVDELRLIVQFDHEKRLMAIEDYLQQL